MYNMNKNVLALAVCSLLTACGGGGGGGATDGTGGAGVGPKDFTLSGSVSGLTGTLDLINTSNQETVSIAGNSFTFSQKLADQAQYDINLASVADGQQLCEVIDGAGSVAAASVTDIEIVCRDWVAATTTLNSGAAEARYPKIARVDDALEVVWFDRQIGAWLFKRAYDAANGWDELAFHSSVDGYRVNSHNVVANNQGESMVTYQSTHPHYGGEFIYASNSLDLSAGSSTEHGRSDSHDIAIDEQGHVLMVWVKPDDLVSTENSVYYKYFDGSWGHEVKLETNTTGGAKHPVVKFTGNGTAVVAWAFTTHFVGPGVAVYDGVQVASFDASKASNKWTADSSVDTANGGCALVVDRSIDIDVTEDGTPTVAWMQGNGQCGSGAYKQPMQISKLEQSTWSAPINISGVDSSSSNGEIIALAGNKILAVYNDSIKTFAKTCDMTTDICSSAVELSADFKEVQSLAKDKNNNVMAAWISGGDAYVNRYDVVNDSWSVMSKINYDTVGNAEVAALDGDFVVTWSENVYLFSTPPSLSSLRSLRAADPTRWTVFAKEFTAQ
jgi:hypothetical protein